MERKRRKMEKRKRGRRWRRKTRRKEEEEGMEEEEGSEGGEAAVSESVMTGVPTHQVLCWTRGASCSHIMWAEMGRGQRKTACDRE